MKLLFLMGAFLGDAEAKKKKKGEGVDVAVMVLDHQSNKPVPTAVIKHPLEEISHKVNEVTGIWQDSEILLPDGQTLHFSPGSAVEFQVSAPGYVTKHIRYDIRRWKNKVDVRLKKIDISSSDEDLIPLDIGGDEHRDPTIGGGGN